MSRNKNKTKKSKPSTLPKNWKTIVLYNVNSEDSCCELTKDENGKAVPPVYHKGVDDWIASVTLIEGVIMGLEEVKVGETLGYAIKNRLWF